MQLTYTAQILKEDSTYIAHAPELDLSSCGDSAAEARKQLHEAVGLFIAGAQKLGTLESILQEAGYRRVGDRWEAPEFIGIERTAFAY